MSRPLSGFTLVEVMLGLALTSILFGLSTVVYQNLPGQNDFSESVAASVSLLTHAQLNASAVTEDSQWGVHFTNEQATLFKGATYGSRDSAFDETAPLWGTVSGTDEYVFDKVSGRPIADGETIFTSSATGETQTIDVNAYGGISAN